MDLMYSKNSPHKSHHELLPSFFKRGLGCIFRSCEKRAPSNFWSSSCRLGVVYGGRSTGESQGGQKREEELPGL